MCSRCRPTTPEKPGLASPHGPVCQLLLLQQTTAKARCTRACCNYGSSQRLFVHACQQGTRNQVRLVVQASDVNLNNALASNTVKLALGWASQNLPRVHKQTNAKS